MTPRFWEGVRRGLPYATAGGLLATSFGVLARDAGMPWWGAVLMSAVVFAGSAQIAALTILNAGGGLGSALGAATLMNSRFLPIGIAFAPSLGGGPVQRAAEGQTVVDASLAIARDEEEEAGYDRGLLLGSSAAQYCTWVGGTAVGAIAGSVIGDPEKLGLDALYPAFFLALMIAELRSGRAKGVAMAGALIALALVPFAPPGVPVLAASLATLIGLVGREGDEP
jgi:predicted branched-subunit amino acid permease